MNFFDLLRAMATVELVHLALLVATVNAIVAVMALHLALNVIRKGGP